MGMGFVSRSDCCWDRVPVGRICECLLQRTLCPPRAILKGGKIDDDPLPAHSMSTSDLTAYVNRISSTRPSPRSVIRARPPILKSARRSLEAWPRRWSNRGIADKSYSRGTRSLYPSIEVNFERSQLSLIPTNRAGLTNVPGSTQASSFTT